jgi:hypothetical protein
MLALLLAVAFAADVSAGQPRITPRITHARVERVAVQTDQFGWHSRHQTLTIARKGTGFTDGTHTIDADALDALVASLSSPPITAIEPGRIGVDNDKMRTAAEDAATRMYPRTLVDDAVARFMQPGVIAERIRALDGSGPGWTDDNPAVRVEVVLAGGETVIATSHSQLPLMLPWTVERRGHTSQTFNPDISRNVADILPDGFVERDRVAGTYLEEFLAEAVAAVVRRPPRRPSEDAHASPDFTVAPATAQFRISSRMFEDGTVKLQATVKNNATQPITIDLATGSLSLTLRCNDRWVAPHAGTLTLTTPPSKPRVLAPRESASFEIPGLFTWANETHTRALMYTAVAGKCRVTFSTWYRLGGAPATAAWRLESNIVTLELVHGSRVGP